MIQSIGKSFTSLLNQSSKAIQYQWNQTRHMSKYLPKSASKRLPLSTKHVRKGFYKGKGGTKEGTFRGKAGRFVLDKERMVELVVPDLTGFKLKPYIARKVSKWAPEDTRAN
jgi:large subunit ribosomal protein L41